MKCVICKSEIEKHYTSEGVLHWDKGNNAMPIADGKCCDKCDNDIVLPHRLAEAILNQGGNNGKSTK